MKKYFFLSALVVLFLTAFQGVSRAVTVTASPSPVAVNQPVTVIVTASYILPPTGASPDCTLAVDFGDGSPWATLAPCTTADCIRSITHTYTTAGQYTITARSLVGACVISPAAPDPATTTLTVTCTPLVVSSSSVLPSGTSGTNYSCTLQATGGQPPYAWTVTGNAMPPGLTLAASGQITGTPTTSGTYNFTAGVSDACPAGVQTRRKQFTLIIECAAIGIISPAVLPAGEAGQPYFQKILSAGGQPPVSFSLTAGAMPPGLTLAASGQITGTPTTSGTYKFTISATDSCVTVIQRIQQEFSLVVGGGDLRVTVSPTLFRIPRNMTSTRTIGYTFSSNSKDTVTLASTRGVFTAGTRVIGETAPLTVLLANGTGTVSEALNIPVAVTLRAEEAGASRILYSRTFMDGPKQVDARTEFIVGLEATAGFSINRLQLYFENRRAEITVKRNQPGLKAFADIRFSGSGLLTGYWEVDGRLLEHVNRHLVYGAPITLASPDVPALPTFYPGTHIVRFVVTGPSADIPIPQALYFVTSEESGKARSIGLRFPEDRSRIPYEAIDFEWQPVKWAETYLIVFFGDMDEKPVFSAYTRKNSYQLPVLILTSLLLKDKNYRWQVKGYDADGNVLGESAVYEVAFSE